MEYPRRKFLLFSCIAIISLLFSPFILAPIKAQELNTGSRSNQSTAQPNDNLGSNQQNVILSDNLNVTCQAPSTCISPQTNVSVLPFLLERLLDSYNGTASSDQLNKTRNQWASQLSWNQKVIADSNGAVLEGPKNSPSTLTNQNSESVMDSQYNYAYLAAIDPSQTSPPESYGYISNPSAMTGPSYDGNFAHLFTDGWSENPSYPIGGEAFAVGWMNTYYSGNVYIYAQTGPYSGSDPPWKNIVMVYGSYDIHTPFLQWGFIGLAYVPSDFTGYVYAGNTGACYSCIAIMCWTPPPYPEPYYPYPDYYNDVEIDFVEADEPYQFSTLSIDSSNLLLTDPGQGTNYWDSGSDVPVTAYSDSNWAFDYWTLDGEYYGTNPSITVTMTRSQHFLVAHFHYIGPPILTVNAYDTFWGGDPIYPNVWVDNNYLGTAWTWTQVSAGTHTIKIDYYYLDQTWNIYCYYAGSGDYNPEDNTISFQIDIYSDTTLTLNYYPC